MMLLILYAELGGPRLNKLQQSSKFSILKLVQLSGNLYFVILGT